jgi:hypothetical protein
VEGILVSGDTDYCADPINNCWFSCTYLQDPPNCSGSACENATRINLEGLLDLIPRLIFVKQSYSGNETGEKTTPFDTIAEGADSLSSAGGDTLVISPGNYPETMTIDTPMTIYNGEFRTGSVKIGM